MDAPSLSARFIVSGVHLSENLLHHKRSDVQRVLEDKGFEAAPGDGKDDHAYCYVMPGAAASDKQTIICFDDKGFVLEDGGVQLLTDGARD